MISGRIAGMILKISLKEIRMGKILTKSPNLWMNLGVCGCIKDNLATIPEAIT